MREPLQYRRARDDFEGSADRGTRLLRSYQRCLRTAHVRGMEGVRRHHGCIPGASVVGAPFVLVTGTLEVESRFQERGQSRGFCRGWEPGCDGSPRIRACPDGEVVRIRKPAVIA